MTADQLTRLVKEQHLLALIPPGPASAGRVLIVDDEISACKLVGAFLAPNRFEYTMVHNGEEALACLRSESFDAVISDLQMPGMSGMELLCEVRLGYPHVAFLVTTGTDNVDVGVEAMRLGADDYLVKPLREGAVLASLKNALYKRQLEQTVEAYSRQLEQMVVERTSQLDHALKQIEQGYENTLRALGAAVDLRDSGTAGHSQRVCRYSLEIARVLGWAERPLANLARGAYLHDIGKLGISDVILLKPGPLTLAERKIMEEHVQIGFDLVKNIPFLADAAELVLSHHERFDGKGYPRGLKGTEIPAGARIFSVADTFDAITSDRPYRKASPIKEALEVIGRESGKQFDPEVAEAFLKIPGEVLVSIALPLIQSGQELGENPVEVRR